MLAVEFIGYILFGFGIGLFTNFLDDCMYQGMIFEKYGKFVNGLGWIGKPLGACIVCFNFWVAFILSYFSFGFLPEELIFAIGMSHFTIVYLTQDKTPKNYTMKCCCENVLNLGCYGSCDDIVVEFETIANQTFTVIAQANGIKTRFEIESEFNQLTIPASRLNESAISVLSIFNADGEQIKFSIEEIEYDCLLVDVSIINQF